MSYTFYAAITALTKSMKGLSESFYLFVPFLNCASGMSDKVL